MHSVVGGKPCHFSLGFMPRPNVTLWVETTAKGLQLLVWGRECGLRVTWVSTAHLSNPQFHDKIDQILESLERIAERLRQPPSISAEVEKIKEQIGENKSVSVDMEKLQPLYETLRQRGQEMIARSEGTEKDRSAKGDETGSDFLSA